MLESKGAETSTSQENNNTLTENGAKEQVSLRLTAVGLLRASAAGVRDP